MRRRRKRDVSVCASCAHDSRKPGAAVVRDGGCAAPRAAGIIRLWPGDANHEPGAGKELRHEHVPDPPRVPAHSRRRRGRGGSGRGGLPERFCRQQARSGAGAARLGRPATVHPRRLLHPLRPGLPLRPRRGEEAPRVLPLHRHGRREDPVREDLPARSRPSSDPADWSAMPSYPLEFYEPVLDGRAGPREGREARGPRPDDAVLAVHVRGAHDQPPDC